MARLQSRQISQLHQYQVLHAVRQAQGPLSRAQIAERTGLSQPAVSSLTRRLLQSAALVEAGARPSNGGGRRERELAVNPDHAWVVGVKLSLHQLTIALSDFAGGVRDTVRVPLSGPLKPAALVRLMVREIESCLARTGGQVRQRLSGVGVALPGFIDSIRGEVLWSAVLSPDTPGAAVPLSDALTEALGVPVMIENDANMFALAEQWFGTAAHLSNVVVVTLEHGLGLGLMINGELFRGHNGLAGELAHVQVADDGQPCRCGKRGCLEAYVAHYGVVRQGQAAGLLDGPPPVQTVAPRLNGKSARGKAGAEPQAGTADADAMPADGVMAAYARLADLARAGNTDAQRIFRDQGEMLGRWIGNVVNLLAPQLVVLDGGGAPASDLYEHAMRSALDRALLLPHRNTVGLVVRHQGDEVWARGAASLVLQRLDESAEIVEAVSRHGIEQDSVGRRPGT